MLLVTGATGTRGSAAMAAAQAADLPFRAPAHSAENAEALRHRGIDVAVGEMARPESLADALRGISVLFLIIQLSPALADVEAATLRGPRGGARRVVKISAFTIGTEFQGGLTAVHAAAEAASHASGLEWTVLRPTPTMGTPLSLGDIHERVPYAPCDKSVAACCAPGNVAGLGVRLLAQGGHAGTVYAVTGPQVLDGCAPVPTPRWCERWNRWSGVPGRPTVRGPRATRRAGSGSVGGERSVAAGIGSCSIVRVSQGVVRAPGVLTRNPSDPAPGCAAVYT
jgi:uncharacterized protein YbjT (DUF2867 family)